VVGTPSIVSETFGKVAHPPPRVTMETNRKKEKKDLALFIGYLIKKEFCSSRSQGFQLALRPSPLNEACHQHNDCDDEQNMDEPSHRITAEEP
jgi:hypothetical protein